MMIWGHLKKTCLLICGFNKMLYNEYNKTGNRPVVCWSPNRKQARGRKAIALSEENNSLTYAEYLKLDDDVQYEVIDGQIYNMSPSPPV